MKRWPLLFSATWFWASMLFPLLSPAAEPVPEAPQTITLGLGAEYATGDYGTPVTTHSVYLPLTATWTPNDRIDLGIEVPYLYQSSSTVTTVIYRTEGMVSSAAMGSGPGGPGGPGGSFSQTMGGSGGTSSTATSTASVSGLGDIVVRLGLIARHEGERAPQLRTSLSVKCPTASKKDGLGTGEFDAGLGVDLSKWFGDLHLLGEGVYNYQGRVAGYGLQNYLSFNAGIGYLFGERIQPMLVVKGSTAPSSYVDDLLEVRARTLWSLNRSTVLDLFLARGLTDSGPDYGGGLNLSYSF